VFKSLRQETELIAEGHDKAVKRWEDVVKNVNTACGDIITLDLLKQGINHNQITDLIFKSELIGTHDTDDVESYDYSNLPDSPEVLAQNYVNATIDMLEKNIETLNAEKIDKSFASRQIAIVLKSVVVAAIFGLSNVVSMSLLAGGLTYLYLAKKEVSCQKSDIHSLYLTDSVIHKQIATILELKSRKH
jgi:hypothetical protein